MDRKEIKSLAKEKIKGNKWNIIWPLLVFGMVSSLLQRLLGGGSLISFDLNNIKDFGVASEDVFKNIMTINYKAQAINTLVSLIMGIATTAYVKYLLNIVRNGSAEFNDIIETIKTRWLQILLANILVSVLVGIATIFFVIPGIILGFAYAMVTYLVVDTDIEAKDALNKSRTMMKGYKWNLFVFNLSFIGWYILVPFTLGLLLIWLMPYHSAAQALYYDKLKEING